ncbi:MAG: lysophospholipid acyltransferase family protein [Desulfobacterales bacterium]
MKKIIENAVYRLMLLSVSLLGHLSLPGARRLGTLLGRLIFRMDRRHRQIAVENIGRAFDFSSKEKERFALRVFENLGMVLMETAWSLRLDETRLAKYFRIIGAENIHCAYQEGKGVLALTAHFGNWELLTLVASLLRHPLSIVYRPLDFQPLERFICHMRTRFGGEQIPKKKAFRRVLKSLARGEMTALLMDQNVAMREGVFADFFGHPACTNAGLALLALKTKAPVVPVFLVREEFGFTAHFLPPLPLRESGDRIRDVESNTAQYNEVTESFVRKYPEQWFWVHRRWNTKPFCPWPKEERG